MTNKVKCLSNCRIESSVFTDRSTAGMLSGNLELPFVPQIGEVISIFLYANAEEIEQLGFFNINLKIKNRIILLNENGSSINLELEDINLRTLQQVRLLSALLEKQLGIYIDI